MAERIASGEIHIGVDDDAAINSLRRIESDFARTMQRIDKQSAEVDLKADHEQLKRDLKRAESEVRKYQKYVNDAETEYTRKARRESLRRAEARLKESKAAEKAHRLRMKAVDEESKAEAQAEARRVAIERRSAQRQRVFEAAEKRRLAGINQEARVRASLDRQREREMARAHSAAVLEERDRQKAVTAIERQERQIRRLQRQYSEAADKAEKLNREARKISTLAAPGVRQRVDIAQREAIAEMALLHAELKAMGAVPVVQHIDLHVDERGVNTLNRWIKAITETTVRVGPLTTTIAGLSRGLLLLGPIISGLVGQVAALTAGVGAGLLGAVGSAIGAIGALGVSLGGVGFLLPSLLRDFGNLNSLQEAYHKQVLKTGAESEKAKTKLKEFKHALGEVAPTTRRAFLSLDELQTRWRNLSKEARPQFFDMLGQGITTLNFHFEDFRKNTLGAFGELNAGWTRWMKGLRSEEAVRILRTLGTNGNESLRPLMAALGNLATYFGRIAESFSHHLPGLMRGFRDWTGGLADGVADADRLNDTTKDLIGSMRAVGHLIMATARFITAFLNPGVDDGTQMMERWAAGLNRAAREMRTTGESGLNDWFRDSIDLANKFWSALKPLAELFFEWTTIMAPFTAIALDVAGALARILEVLLGFGPTKAVLQGLFAVFLYGALVKRVASVASGMRSIAAAVMGIKAAGGIGGALKGGLLRFATGGMRGQTPATPMYVMNVGPTGGVPGGGGRGGPGGGGGVLGRLSPAARVGGGLTAAAAGVITLTKAIDDLHRKKGLESLDRKLATMVRRRDMSGLIDLRREIQDFGGGDAPAAIDRVNRAMGALEANMDRDTRNIVRSIKGSWDRVHSESKVTFDRVRKLATFNFRVIEDNMGKHSAGGARAASKNFWQARRAIKSSIEAGTIDTKKGHALIEKLWIEALSFYGFTPKQAKNIQKGRSYTGGREEGQSGIGKARGGLMDVGRKGVAARDNIPAMLGGRPAIVAEGEQIAVFNRHQQQAMDRMLPGGLEGFFGSHRRPHYAARGGIVDRYQGGGIVPVPGFPGEMAAASILDEIAMVTRQFGLVLTDAYGPGHESPGHTIHGTAADFAGPDRNMNAAVKALVAAGYLVGYDGSFGSADWPGHGPAAGQGGGNAHFHVEFGSKGGQLGMAAVVKQIARVIMQDDLGAVSAIGQRALDVTRDAANANLEAVAAASMMVPTAGGHGVGPGAGAATRGQMVRWATMALERTRHLGHGGATAGNIAKILDLAMKESSWIVDSINNWDINAKNGNPSGGLMHVTIDKVGGSKAALFDPVTNMIASIVYQMQRYGGLITHSPYAAGGIIDQMPQSQWSRGGKVDRPTLMTGEDGRKAPEFVISTNRQFRSSNLGHLQQAAAALGVPMAREGKADKGRKPRFIKGAGRDAEKLPAVKRYGVIQGQEEDKRREISIAEQRVREPESLIKEKGKDANGDPIYEIDQSAVDGYLKQMSVVKKLYNELIQGIMARLRKQADKVAEAINKYINSRETNISNLEEDRAINQRLLKSKDKSVRAKARKRLEKTNEMLRDQREKIGDARRVHGEVRDDQHDAGYRVQEYRIARDDLVRDMNAVQGRAAEDVRSSNPTPETVTPPEPIDPNDAALARLGAEQALAEIGQGVNGQPARSMEAILTDQKRVQEARISGAQAMLRDADPTNDIDAYGIIADAAGAIQSLNEALGQLPTSPQMMAQDRASLTVALGDLGREFGSNFAVASGMGLLRSLPGGGFSTGGVTAPFSGGGNTIVNVENTFPTPPADPHTWSRNLAYELQVAL